MKIARTKVDKDTVVEKEKETKYRAKLVNESKVR